MAPLALPKVRLSVVCQSSASVDGSKAAISSTGKTGHFLAADRDARVLLRGLVGAQVGMDFGAPAPRAALEHMGVMKQPIEERRHGGGIAE